MAVLTQGLAPQPVYAQSPAPLVSDSATVVAGPRYGAGWLHRWLLGSNYRDLWTTPMRIEVLDLDTFAGGLHPVEHDSTGDIQPRSLRFAGADGREYEFRTVNRDVIRLLPPDLRGTLAARILQDQVSASHPASPAVADPIAAAAGVFHRSLTLVYLPETPRLGQFQRDFGGVPGFLEQLPTDGSDAPPGSTGAPELVTTDEMLLQINTRPGNHVDPDYFLRARLLDVYLGNWDLEQDQWRWAGKPDGDGVLWMPVSQHRELAFVQFGGMIPQIARNTFPQLLTFGPRYGPVVASTWNGRNLDRRFLAPLGRPAWDSMAAELASLLTDRVIDSAVARMPAEYRALNGAWLRAALISRRDRLPKQADKYYRLLAGQVDLYATGVNDSTAVTRVDDEHVRVQFFSESATASGGSAYIDRTFWSRETSDVRLYLLGGDDRVVFIGAGTFPVTVRAIGGDGNDQLLDPEKNRKVHFYDDDGTTAIGHALDSKRWPPTSSPRDSSARDWGARSDYTPLIAGGPDIGVLFGVSASYFRYGFRKVAYSSNWRVRVGYATGAQTLNGDILGDIRLANSNTHFTILARASGIATLNFYGFGNNTTDPEPNEFYRVRQNQFTLEPGITFQLTRRSTLSLSAKGVYSVTSDDQDRYIGTQTVLGTGDFGQLGASAVVAWSANRAASPTSTGVDASIGGSIYAPVWSVPSTYAELHAVVNWSWNLYPRGVKPTLGFRVGGMKVWGDYPFMDAAFIGGAVTVRSLRYNRFAGDASLYGGAELRLQLARVSRALASDLGVLGLVDVGRVFIEGESSRTWHPSYGGGIWFAFLNERTRATVSVAGGAGAARFYFNFGLTP